MFVNTSPRSRWPKGCFRVTAWHKDEHLLRLLAETRRVNEELDLRPGVESLPSTTIAILVDRAVSATDIYTATAHLEPLYDAFESFPAMLSAFEVQFTAGTRRVRQRISCCLGYVLAQGINRRDPLSRHFSVVAEDHAHFKALWARAESLRQSMQGQWPEA